MEDIVAILLLIECTGFFHVLNDDGFFTATLMKIMLWKSIRNDKKVPSAWPQQDIYIVKYFTMYNLTLQST